jgi:hypothetical protein
MKTVAMENSTLTAEELVDLAEHEPVILTRNGEPLVSIKNVSGSDWETVSLSNHPEFTAMIEASRRSYRENGGSSLEQVRKEFGLKPLKTPPSEPG